MTGVVKGILISAIALVLVMVIIIGAAIYWVSSHGGEWLEKTKESVAEGERFGKGTDNQGCITEALARHRKNASMSGALATQLFLASCLPSSDPTPGFCDDVPKRLEFLKSAQWQALQCQRADLRDRYCPQLFAQVQNFCEAAGRRSSLLDHRPGARPASVLQKVH